MINKASFPNTAAVGAQLYCAPTSPLQLEKTAAPTEAMFLNKQEPFSKISRAIIRANLQTRKTATPPGGYVFQRTVTIFKLSRDVNSTNVLTKFHEYWTINVHSRVLKMFHVSHIRKTAPPPGGHWNINVNPRVLTRFNYSYSWKTAPIIAIIESNVMTKFYKDRTISVTSRVLTSKTATPLSAITHVLTTFHNYWTKNKTSIPYNEISHAPGGDAFQLTETIFNVSQDIIGTLVLEKFHVNWTIHVTSRVLTSFCFYLTSIELDQNIIGTNHLTKFYECYQGKILTTHDGQKVIPKAHHKHVVLR
ncbi:hypothetical protein DPMN_005933 [Dreissena polymorpha]|uniref:Uncharacterized protein n=1 Tax=Dreissena polymorpha TaxID=45954 RepID=A0A9D4MUA3_DREPO|nr:hypothetical protein DPMN_005933 [Dreissena polymorpha]